MKSRLLVVLRPLGLGDALAAVPAYKALARAFPDHLRVYAGPPALASLVPLFGAFDAFVAVQPHAQLPEELTEADVMIDMHGRGPRSQRVCLASRPRRLIAYANDEVPETAGMAIWRDDEHETDRWCRLIEHCGIPVDRDDLSIETPRSRLGARARGATIVHPGAKAVARRWPVERFAAVARNELRRGRRVLITGGTDEIELGLELARLSGVRRHDVLAGRTDYAELAGLVANADRVVCGDTGIAHLATAYGTPSVVLFGPTPPALWGPPPGRGHRVLWGGRRGDPHGTHVDRSLLAITEQQVIELCEQLGAPRNRAS
jgi:ADP-heptose:LPS heptosyltransferase